MRIKGVPRKEKERSDEVLDQVKKSFEEAEATIPDSVLDRALRVSENNHDLVGRFTTFRHRTLFYRERKTLKGKSTFRFDKFSTETAQWCKEFDK